MPYFLRSIRRSRWYSEETHAWLPVGEVPADALGDLATSENALSLWYVDDEQSNLQRVVAALASRRDTVANLDYVLIGANDVAGLKIEDRENPGDSADPEANERWHRDLIHLTASGLAELAFVALHKGIRERINESDVRGLLVQGLRAGQLRKDAMKESLLRRVQSAD